MPAPAGARRVAEGACRPPPRVTFALVADDTTTSGPGESERPGGDAGRRAAGPPARRLDRDLLARHRDLARARPLPRGRRQELLRRQRPGQRVQHRVPRPEHDPGARRRRRALVGLRAGVQRPAREGRAQARLARRLVALLADPARPRRPERALHPARAVADAAALPGLPPAADRALAGALPDRRAARRLRDRRRDPQQLRRVLDPGADARRLEPRDHRRARVRRAARRRHRQQALRLRRARSSSGRSCSSCCRSRGCAGGTAGCRW